MAPAPEKRTPEKQTDEQQTGIIAFQGEPGAYSHLACRQARPGMDPLPCATFEDAYQAVTNGDADLAMIAVENSLAGRVADNHHLLPESGLHIIGEHFLPVNHKLLALPGVPLEEITDVYSHVHALGQHEQRLHHAVVPTQPIRYMMF